MYKFILVDDEPLIRRGILKKIESFNQQITCSGEANNGEDALVLIKEVDPDIIFTDMRMPGMDGKSLLRVLQQDYPDKKIIVISGHTDFEYMQEAISAKVVNYLLKPFNREEVHNALHNAIALIEKDKSLKNRIESIEDEKVQISHYVDLQSLSNIILGIHVEDNISNIKSEKLKAIGTSYNYVLFTVYSRDKIKKDQLSVLVHENNLAHHFLFIEHAQLDSVGFFLFLLNKGNGYRALTSQLVKPLTNEVLIGVSCIRDDILQLNQAYKETISALNKRSISNDTGLFFFDDKEETFDTLEWDKKEDLLFFIESGNTSKVVEFISNFFSNFSPETTLSTVKYCSQNLFNEVRNLLYGYFTSPASNSLSASFESIIDTLFDVNAIRAYFLQILPNISEMLGQKNIYSSQSIVDNIKTYINKNYTKSLTLEKISSLFFINSSYCSFIFKEKTGENFVDYINKVRIEKSKELLRNTDDKVYKIAKTLGFDNPKYFFRVFKKVTGYTPEEYRMR